MNQVLRDGRRSKIEQINNKTKHVNNLTTNLDLDMRQNFLNSCCFIFKQGFGGKQDSISSMTFFCYVSFFLCKLVFLEKCYFCGRIGRGMWRKLTKTKDLHNKIWSILASKGHVKTFNNGVVSRSKSQYLKPYFNTCFEVVCIKLKLIFCHWVS